MVRATSGEDAVPISWRGRNWLDTEIAKRPFLERYWVDGQMEEVRRLLEMARQEEAGLARGAIDASERVRRVVDLLNEGDPYYRYRVTSDGESSSVTPIPRYRGAADDYPIIFRAEFAFPSTPEAQAVADELRGAIDFGTPVRIPGEYIRRFEASGPIQLLPDTGAQMLEMRPVESERRPLPLILGVSTPDGRPLGELPIAGVITSRGGRGAKLEGKDRSGVVTLEMTLDAAEQRVTANLTVAHPKTAFFAGDLRDPIRALKHAVAPNLIEFRTLDGFTFSKGRVPFEESLVEDGFDDFLEDLLLVQWASGLNRPVGPGFDRKEVADVSAAARLLRGETVTGTWGNIEITMNEDAEMESRRALVGEPRSMRVVVHKGATATVTGVDYQVGDAVESIFESVVLAPEHAADSRDGVPVGVPLRFVPGSSDKVARRLISANTLESPA